MSDYNAEFDRFLGLDGLYFKADDDVFNPCPIDITDFAQEDLSDSSSHSSPVFASPLRLPSPSPTDGISLTDEQRDDWRSFQNKIAACVKLESPALAPSRFASPSPGPVMRITARLPARARYSSPSPLTFDSDAESDGDDSVKDEDYQPEPEPEFSSGSSTRKRRRSSITFTLVPEAAPKAKKPKTSGAHSHSHRRARSGRKGFKLEASGSGFIPSAGGSSRSTPPPRNVQVTGACAEEIRRRLKWSKNTCKDWVCPACGWAQLNHRMPDYRRHLNTHITEIVILCRGVLQQNADGETIYIGGCGKTFSRADALSRHLNNPKSKCHPQNC